MRSYKVDTYIIYNIYIWLKAPLDGGGNLQ